MHESLPRWLSSVEEEMSNLYKENEKLTSALRRIESMCGNPDAAEGCRIILKFIRETIGDRKDGV